MKSLSVDALPVELVNPFLQSAAAQGRHWYDMLSLCFDYGMRNAEARCLQRDEIDIDKNIITLHRAKQIKSHITKTTNMLLADKWLPMGQHFLFANCPYVEQRFLPATAKNPSDLSNIAKMWGIQSQYECVFDEFVKDNRQHLADKAARSAPPAREIFIDKSDRAQEIVLRRFKQYAHFNEYLFPSNESRGGRATSWEPFNRNTVAWNIKCIISRMLEMDPTLIESVQGIRVGLHTGRKTSVQEAVKILGSVLDAGREHHHGNGRGCEKTTNAYLDTSQKSLIAIREKTRQAKREQNAKQSQNGQGQVFLFDNTV